MTYEDDPGKQFYFLASGISIKTRRLVEKQLKPFNLTWPQIGVMMRVSQNENFNQKELADLMDTDATTVMVICDSLEKKKLLKRKPDANDRRVNRIVLTDKGKAVFKEAYQIIQKDYDTLFRRIPKEELKETVRVMEKIYQIVKEIECSQKDN